MRIDRMLAITVMLLNRERISAKELSEKFEVSVRTIYRDIDAINLAGIPIISYSGNNGGFGIMENYKIDKQLLTLKDMFAILSALKGINATLDNKQLDLAIEKVHSLIPREKSDDLNLHIEQLTIDILPWGYSSKQKNIFKKIHQAISNQNLIEFAYTNLKSEKSNRKVEPMTLLFKGNTWYLFAYCCLKKDYRIFRLSRIKQLNILEENYIRKDKKYKEVMKDSERSMKFIELVLKFSEQVRVKIEDLFDEDMITKNEMGELVVTAMIPDDDWMYSTILSFTDEVEVIKPLHVRNIIKEKLKKVVELYQ